MSLICLKLFLMLIKRDLTVDAFQHHNPLNYWNAFNSARFFPKEDFAFIKGKSNPVFQFGPFMGDAAYLDSTIFNGAVSGPGIQLQNKLVVEGFRDRYWIHYFSPL